MSPPWWKELDALLAACENDGTNPFIEETEDEAVAEENGDTDGDGETDADVQSASLPPGTASPTPDDRIVRFEAEDTDGGGFVQDVRYRAGNDRLVIDNLAFDGKNVYRRSGGTDSDTAFGSLGGYAVYEADVTTEDFLTGEDVTQIVPYRALYGVSRNQVDGEARTSFVIVRTGGYVQYGFGGFIYERNGSVVLPDSGQAVFKGGYAGLRVFGDRAGLEYTEADMRLSFDFDDFNDGAAIKGRVFNRQVFDEDGNAVALGTGDGDLPAPNINWVIDGSGTTLTEDGEFTGQVFSTYIDDGGTAVEYENGTYYGIIAGDTTDPDDGGEVVGVLVVDSTDPRTGGPVKETGGFILYR